MISAEEGFSPSFLLHTFSFQPPQALLWPTTRATSHQGTPLVAPTGRDFDWDLLVAARPSDLAGLCSGHLLGFLCSQTPPAPAASAFLLPLCSSSSSSSPSTYQSHLETFAGALPPSVFLPLFRSPVVVPPCSLWPCLVVSSHGARPIRSCPAPAHSIFWFLPQDYELLKSSTLSY